VVNLAARLCSQAQAGQILVDPKVHAAIEILTDTEPAGELTLKGLSRAIKAFNIAGFRAVSARRLHAHKGPFFSPFSPNPWR
jgi:adenylate cyclase